MASPTFAVGTVSGIEPLEVTVPEGALAVVVPGAGELLHPELQAMAVIDAMLEHAPGLRNDKAACARVVAWAADRWAVPA